MRSPFLDAETVLLPNEAPAAWPPLNLDSPYVHGAIVAEAPAEEELGIIDGEDRKPVDPLQVPFRWICSVSAVLDITRRSGGTSKAGPAPFGSGTLMSPRHVLTAAHVLKGVDRDGDGQIIDWFEARTVLVKFGRDGDSTMVEVEADHWDLPRGWKPESKVTNFDFALITLKDPVGEQVFKALGSQALNWWGGAANTVLGNLPATLASRLLGARVLTAGYPQSSKGRMMCASGVLSSGSSSLDTALKTPQAVQRWADGATLFSMTADATEGQSGSPVWLNDDGRRYLIGIAVNAGNQFNGVRPYNAFVQRCIDGWIGKAAGSGEIEGESAFELDGESATAGAAEESAEGFVPSFEAEPPGGFERDQSAVDQALASQDWRGALRAAIAAGEHDENKLTNLLFFARHPALDPTRPLQPQTSKEDARLAAEWTGIDSREVWPAIEESAEDPVLAVHGSQVASPLQQFRGTAGRRFKQLVEDAAQKVDLNPGLLAAALIGETGTIADYLSPAKVGSYRTGVDDFYPMRSVLAKNVPAYAQIHWDKTQKPVAHLNDAQTNQREVQSIWFDSGADALLATAVYLKYGEVRLKSDAVELGGNFEALPVETRFALIRMSMAAGRAGAKARLVRALKGEDILLRNWASPVIYHTDRNATIRAAEAMFLSNWVFGQPLPAPVAPQAAKAQPELEAPERDSEAPFGQRGEESAASEELEERDEVAHDGGDEALAQDDEESGAYEVTEDEAERDEFDTQEFDLRPAPPLRASTRPGFEHDVPQAKVREVMVGERIDLDLATTPFAGKFDSVQWMIPGRAVRGYDGGVNDAKLFELAASDLQRPKITFYWVDGGDGRTVRARLRNRSGDAAEYTAVFDVKAPVVNVFEARRGALRLIKRAGLTGMQLGKADVEAPGIKWHWKITLPAAHAGHVKDVQTVLEDRTQVLLLEPGGSETRTLVRRHPQKTEPHLQLDGAADGQAGYTDGLGELPVSVGDSFTDSTTSDSPFTELPKLARSVTVNDQFTYFILFRPDVTKAGPSIWVPVAKATWAWKASAKQRAGRWLLTPVKTTPAFQKSTTDFPLYDSNVESNEWQELAPPASSPKQR